MTVQRIFLAAGLLAMWGLTLEAKAAELGAESIVHEQAQSARALAEQSQYRAYHQRFKDLELHQHVAPTAMPHHN